MNERTTGAHRNGMPAVPAPDGRTDSLYHIHVLWYFLENHHLKFNLGREKTWLGKTEHKSSRSDMIFRIVDIIDIAASMKMSCASVNCPELQCTWFYDTKRWLPWCTTNIMLFSRKIFGMPNLFLTTDFLDFQLTPHICTVPSPDLRHGRWPF